MRFNVHNNISSDLIDPVKKKKNSDEEDMSDLDRIIDNMSDFEDKEKDKDEDDI